MVAIAARSASSSQIVVRFFIRPSIAHYHTRGKGFSPLQATRIYPQWRGARSFDPLQTGMAPPKKGNGGGWARLPSLSLLNYAFPWSRSHASGTSVGAYKGVAEAAGLYPLRSVTLLISFVKTIIRHMS